MLKSLPENKNYVESVSENGNDCLSVFSKMILIDDSMYFIDSNLASDLYMRFADEPFYQFYAASLSEVCDILLFTKW